MAIQFRRGKKEELVKENFLAAEPGFTLDTRELIIGTGAGEAATIGGTVLIGPKGDKGEQGPMGLIHGVYPEIAKTTFNPRMVDVPFESIDEMEQYPFLVYSRFGVLNEPYVITVNLKPHTLSVTAPVQVMLPGGYRQDVLPGTFFPGSVYCVQYKESPYSGEEDGYFQLLFPTAPYFQPDILVEAENSPLGRAQLRINPMASGGRYVGSIDNPGDGIQVQVRPPVAGKYKMTVYYMTASPIARHGLFEGNGTTPLGRFIYTVNTGWCESANVCFQPSSIHLDLLAQPYTFQIKKTSEEDGFAEIDCVSFSKVV